ncbi:MAG: hypothetical protein HQM05_15340 [Magnetococcales bacterium]|nr:hypothetical protein [Magnetococcales bacterium]
MKDPLKEIMDRIEAERLRRQKKETRNKMPSNGTQVPGVFYLVIHDDADDVGRLTPKFATRAEAEAKCREWNETYPGHRVTSCDVGKDFVGDCR